MNLGAFSVSLAVKDIEKSKQFYENLGFSVFGGDQSQNWLILKSGDHIIGLFQGMFENNLLTFNPGWDQNAQNTDSFDDIREIHKKVKDAGIATAGDTFESDSGPASFMVTDPDGNTILFDQHR